MLRVWTAGHVQDRLALRDVLRVGRECAQHLTRSLSDHVFALQKRQSTRAPRLLGLLALHRVQRVVQADAKRLHLNHRSRVKSHPILSAVPQQGGAKDDVAPRGVNRTTEEDRLIPALCVTEDVFLAHTDERVSSSSSKKK